MPAKHKRNLFRPGDWFEVPLRDEWSALGRVARLSRTRSVSLCYFFEPHLSSSLIRASFPESQDAVAILRVDSEALRKGYWRVLCSEDAWNPEAWPTPIYAKYEDLDGRSWLVIYPDDDPDKPAEVAPTTSEEARHYTVDSFVPRQIVERLLEKIIPEVRSELGEAVHSEETWSSSFASGRDALRAAQQLQVIDMITSIDYDGRSFKVVASEGRIGHPRSRQALQRLFVEVSQECNGIPHEGEPTRRG